MKRTAKAGASDIPKWLSHSTTLGLDSDLKVDQTDKIDALMVDRQNKTRFNDFLRSERLAREQSMRVAQKMKSTNRLPPQTLEEYKNDIDLGLDGGLIDLDPPAL